MKIETKDWPSIIVKGIIMLPLLPINGVIWGVAYLMVALLCVTIIGPANYINNYIKRKHNESLQNRSKN